MGLPRAGILEILRCKGEAQRNAILAEAVQRDPAFVEFYRPMGAYSQAIKSRRHEVISTDRRFLSRMR